jgi:hypothetical protein
MHIQASHCHIFVQLAPRGSEKFVRLPSSNVSIDRGVRGSFPTNSAVVKACREI